MIGSGRQENGLYYMELVSEVKTTVICNNTIAESHSYSLPVSDLWHYRLGHLSTNRLSILIEKFPHAKFTLPSSHTCDICQFAKQKCLSYSLSPYNASKIFELVHLDIWGPFSTSSMHDHRHFLTILDDFSRYKNQNRKFQPN